MKILHVTKKYPPAIGGDAMVVSILEKQQVESGHNVAILTSNCIEIPAGNQVLKFGLKEAAQNLDRITLKRLFSLVLLFMDSFRLLRRIRPDLIHCHEEDLGFALSLASRWTKTPMIVTCHGVSFPYQQYFWLKRMAERFFLKYSGFKKIITVDEMSLPSFAQANIPNAIFIPNGINVKMFEREHRKRSDRTIFLFVGRLEEQKGLLYLLLAAQSLLQMNPNFEIHLIGEGSLDSYLKEQVGKLGLQNHIRFLGSKRPEDMVDYYLQSDIFILPSIWEGMPLTLLEAWAAGLPVIITPVGSIPKICQDGENALLIPPRDAPKTAQAMFMLLQDQNLRKKLGERGKCLVYRDYTWDKFAQRVEKIYDEVLEQEG